MSERKHSLNVPLNAEERKALEVMAEKGTRSLSGEMLHIFRQYRAILKNKKLTALIRAEKSKHE